MASHFIKLPPEGASVFGALCYVFEPQQTAQTLDVKILDATQNTTLGRLRFYNTQHLECDISPYLLALADCSPLPPISPTGVYPATDREINIELRVTYNTLPDTPGQPSVFHEERSPRRRFVFARQRLAGNEIRSSLPSQRLAGFSDSEEILFHNLSPIRITLTATGRKPMPIRTFEVREAGQHIFCLNCSEYPDAEKITVEIEKAGRIEYTMIRRPRGSVRMAWTSRYGSVEHYTFPVVQEIDRHRVKNAARSEVRCTLRSAFENRAMMEGLSEIISSAGVWMLDKGTLRTVDILTDTLKIHEHGSLSVADIVICTPQNDPLRWN